MSKKEIKKITISAKEVVMSIISFLFVFYLIEYFKNNPDVRNVLFEPIMDTNNVIALLFFGVWFVILVFFKLNGGTKK
ncbi:MAG: hypothetical protein AB1782_16660 [Cyanobacteriota bacterium]